MRDSVHFPLIAVPGFRSRAVRRVELRSVGYFVRFGHPILFYIFIVKIKKNIIISRTVQQ